MDRVNCNPRHLYMGGKPNDQHRSGTHLLLKRLQSVTLKDVFSYQPFVMSDGLHYAEYRCGTFRLTFPENLSLSPPPFFHEGRL